MEIGRECRSQSVQRSSLHRIDNQISISNTWFIVDPVASFRSGQRKVSYSLGFPQELGFLKSGEQRVRLFRRQAIQTLQCKEVYSRKKIVNLTEVLGAQSRKPSGLFGRLMGLLMNWRHRPLSKWTIELMNIQPDDFVLDIGCGAGMAIEEIAEIATSGFVAGVDYSEIMVRQALKHNAASVRAMRVVIKNGNISMLPFQDESFDKACAIESFNFWPDPIAGLKEAHRVLRPKGLVAIATGWSKEMPKQQKYVAMAHRMRFSLYSGSEMVEMLTAAGFLQAQFTVKAGKNWLCAIGVK